MNEPVVAVNKKQVVVVNPATDSLPASVATTRPESARQFVIIALAVAGSLLIANLMLSAMMIGKPTASSAALCRQVDTRVDLAGQHEGSRVVLIGGSGVRAGLSAQRMSQVMGVNVFNFGLQASFGPEIILHQAKRLLRPGDSAVLLFEYPMYFQDSWNPVALNYAMGCLPELILSQPVKKLSEALMALNFAHIWEALSYRPTESGPAPLAANAYGDRLPGSFPPLSSSKTERLHYYQPAAIGIDPGASGPKAIKRFAEFARQEGIQVIASWPNTIDFPEYQRVSGFADIKRFYNNLGVTVVGAPSLGLLPVTDFYDTQYHLNYAAIKHRTDRFINALREQNIVF